VVDLTSSIWS